MQQVEKIAEYTFFHFNQYNRCKTYTRCEKGSGVDQFYKKEYIRLIFAKKRLQQLEKVAEEVKFRREAKKLQPKTQQVGKSSGTNFFKSI